MHNKAQTLPKGYVIISYVYSWIYTVFLDLFAFFKKDIIKKKKVNQENKPCNLAAVHGDSLVLLLSHKLLLGWNRGKGTGTEFVLVI